MHQNLERFRRPNYHCTCGHSAIESCTYRFSKADPRLRRRRHSCAADVAPSVRLVSAAAQDFERDQDTMLVARMGATLGRATCVRQVCWAASVLESEFKTRRLLQQTFAPIAPRKHI